MNKNTDNILQLVEGLEKQRREIEANVEQLQYKVTILKKRKDEVRRNLTNIIKQKSDKETIAATIKSRVDKQQECVNTEQVNIDRSQSCLKDYSQQTTDQSYKRFDMIGEFEQEFLKLCHKMGNQSLNDTMSKLDSNLKIKAQNRDKLKHDLFVTTAEVRAITDEKILQDKTKEITNVYDGSLSVLSEIEDNIATSDDDDKTEMNTPVKNDSLMNDSLMRFWVMYFHKWCRIIIVNIQLAYYA